MGTEKNAHSGKEISFWMLYILALICNVLWHKFNAGIEDVFSHGTLFAK
jgi:hypothetical protein